MKLHFENNDRGLPPNLLNWTVAFFTQTDNESAPTKGKKLELREPERDAVNVYIVHTICARQ